MRIFGIGIDVVEVDRIASAVERLGEPFLAKLFTPDERGYCEAQKNSSLHYAARFAAKEAAQKAIGTAAGTRWVDYVVLQDADGKPHLELRGTAAARAAAVGAVRLHVSMSHDAGIATATVIAES
jgi:holo-[acyl-carrier protein] synthase